MKIWGTLLIWLCLSSVGEAGPTAGINPSCVDTREREVGDQVQQCAQIADQIVSKIQSSESVIAPVARALQAEGFRCRPPSARTGLTCFGKLSSYPKEISLVVPPAFRPTPRAETILFLHGNNLGRESLEAQNARSNWGAMLADTGRNQILIAPLSHGRTEDFEKSLATAEHFVPFQKSVADLLSRVGLAQKPEIGQITLTGHSGAYRSLAAIAKGGWLADHIHELALFDSAYGRSPEFTEFAAKSGHRFWSAFNPSDPDLLRTNQEIMNNLLKSGRGFLKAKNGNVEAAAIRSNPVGFVPTNGDHYGAIPTYFRLFLNKK